MMYIRIFVICYFHIYLEIQKRALKSLHFASSTVPVLCVIKLQVHVFFGHFLYLETSSVFTGMPVDGGIREVS